MAKDAAEVYGEAVQLAERQGTGLGGSLGRVLLDRKARNADSSILATATELGVSVTVHVTLGADVVHMHPNIDGGLLGRASQWDFRMLCSIVPDRAARDPAAAVAAGDP